LSINNALTKLKYSIFGLFRNYFESLNLQGKVHVYSVSLKQEAQLMLTNLHDAFGGQSRSPNIVPFHMLGIVSYCAIVTLSLRRAIFTIFNFKNVVT